MMINIFTKVWLTNVLTIFFTVMFCVLGLIYTPVSHATRDCKLLNTQWGSLCSILEKRTTQKHCKMKLSYFEASELEHFLLNSKLEYVQLKILKNKLPKTTLELLMAIRFREVSLSEAEKIADYLYNLVLAYDFKNIHAFDENTSHIIGRDWHQIDYANEGMTWQGQQAKYKKYNITNFKSLHNIQKFFPVESKLPYFAKCYQPRNNYKI